MKFPCALTPEAVIRGDVLVDLCSIGHYRVVFTSKLWNEYEDKSECLQVVKRGLELLKQPDQQDSPHMKVRVIEPDRIWVIEEPIGRSRTEGKLTYLRPSDSCE